MYLLKKCIISLFVCTAISGAVISVGMMKNMPVFKNSEKNVIVIDPGHGGGDPGKVGVDGSLEKDINLAISQYLKKELQDKNYKVIMTREKDTGLYDESDTNKKIADLHKRIEIMNQSDVKLVVSIHQNSYHEENVFGAQVFYYQTSTEGEKAAGIIQDALQKVNPDNTKKIKANNTYYILKKTEVPTVIVECGFLSNYKEAQKLVTEDYQKSVAEAVAEGILSYIKENE